MKHISIILAVLLTTGCGKFYTKRYHTNESGQMIIPVASAIISVGESNKFQSLDVPQANGVVSIVYEIGSVKSFALGTTGFMSGSYPQVVGNYLELGSISINTLDDNSLKVCGGIKCNRLYVRVFTLGSNVSGSIINVQGFINVDEIVPYGVDVLAGVVSTPIGYNANANASLVTDAANVFTYTIPSNLNRVRLTNTGVISFPVKVDLSNAGSGNYEMRLVVQYALGYVP